MPCPWAGGKQPADIIPRSVVVVGTGVFVPSRKKDLYRALDKYTFWVPCPRVVTAETPPAEWAEANWWTRSVHQSRWYKTDDQMIRALLKDAGPKGMCLIFRTAAPMTKFQNNLLGAAQDVLKLNRIKVIKL